MSLQLNRSKVEELMIVILSKRKKPLSLIEIAEAIRKRNKSILKGSTPQNSLYSILYKREKMRVANGVKPLFHTENDKQRRTYWSLNM